MGVIDNGWWLRADPVHLHPERDRLVLTDSQMLDVTQDEANGLVAEIMEHYKADGWLLKAARPGRWYLKPPRAPKMTTTSLPEVIGHDIHPYLPQGKDGKAWHTVLNEMQILLHTAKVNEERERHGKLPINSLWFWGGGRLPKLKPVAWTQLWSEEPLSLAFARLAQVPSRAQPADFEAWRRQADRGGEHLIVLDGLRVTQQYADESAWATAMTQLEHQWIAPLFAAVRAKARSRTPPSSPTTAGNTGSRAGRRAAGGAGAGRSRRTHEAPPDPQTPPAGCCVAARYRRAGTICHRTCIRCCGACIARVRCARPPNWIAPWIDCCHRRNCSAWNRP